MHFLLTLLLQIAVILLACRLVGLVFRRFHQPQVVGEMAAGILLGPTFFGWIWPEGSAFVFPPGSLPHLNTLSQTGLVVYMFLVGLEFDPKLLRGRGHAAVVTSHVSIIAPFFLGSVLALYLYPRLSDESVSFDGFALFVGAAMSVTAFPVLARILSERNLLKTRVGAVTIACAAVDDVTAWTILAVVIAIVRANALETPLWLTLAGSAAYIVIMIFVVRPALRLFERRYHERGRFSQDLVAIALLCLLASAWTTEWLGIHALFGAFAIGAAMPKDPGFVHQLTEKLEDLTVVFLLPLFFASAGLKTSIGGFGAEMWGYFGLIMLVAVAGKLGGSAIAARITGLNWREAGALGILMNTRGLMELVILTIGLELGVISPALFTMMVFMALATTMMTTPVVRWLYPTHQLHADQVESGDDELRVLIPVALPGSGPGLLRVAAALSHDAPARRLYPLHLKVPKSELVREGDTPPRDEPTLKPLIDAAQAGDLEVRPLVFATQDTGRDIANLARVKGAHLTVMGWHRPFVIGDGILGGTVHDAMGSLDGSVAIYAERSFEPWRRALVPYRGKADGPALSAARRIALAEPGLRVVILRVGADAVDDEAELAELAELGDRVEVVPAVGDDPVEAVLAAATRLEADLLVLTIAEAWGLDGSFHLRPERIARKSNASLLLLRGPLPATAERRAPAPTALKAVEAGR
ncbi:MAG: cation:proton antiporter [Sandaracinaceae bacterium]|nr:cation:proton antiporter [Sandaracinaceae bacterium]